MRTRPSHRTRGSVCCILWGWLWTRILAILSFNFLMHKKKQWWQWQWHLLQEWNEEGTGWVLHSASTQQILKPWPLWLLYVCLQTPEATGQSTGGGGPDPTEALGPDSSLHLPGLTLWFCPGSTWDQVTCKFPSNFPGQKNIMLMYWGWGTEAGSVCAWTVFVEPNQVFTQHKEWRISLQRGLSGHIQRPLQSPRKWVMLRPSYSWKQSWVVHNHLPCPPPPSLVLRPNRDAKHRGDLFAQLVCSSLRHQTGGSLLGQGRRECPMEQEREDEGLVGQEDIQGEGKTWTAGIEDQGADCRKLHAAVISYAPSHPTVTPNLRTACYCTCFSAQEECGDLDAQHGQPPMTRESRQERLHPWMICATVTYVALHGEKGGMQFHQGWARQSCLWEAPTAHARVTPPTAAPAHVQLPSSGSSQWTKSCAGLRSLRLMSAPPHGAPV